MTWTVDIPVEVQETRPETPEVQTLSLLTGDSETPAGATIQLGVKVDGLWHPAVAIEVLRLEDRPVVETMPAGEGEAPAPQLTLPTGAADMRDMILTARVDSRSRLAQQFGIADGTPLSEAIPQATWGFLYPAAAR